MPIFFLINPTVEDQKFKLFVPQLRTQVNLSEQQGTCFSNLVIS